MLDLGGASETTRDIAATTSHPPSGASLPPCQQTPVSSTSCPPPRTRVLQGEKPIPRTWGGREPTRNFSCLRLAQVWTCGEAPHVTAAATPAPRTAGPKFTPDNFLAKAFYIWSSLCPGRLFMSPPAIDFYMQERNSLINRTIRTYWNIFHGSNLLKKCKMLI